MIFATKNAISNRQMEHINRLAEQRKGTKFSQEWRNKISKTRKERFKTGQIKKSKQNYTPELRAKRSAIAKELHKKGILKPVIFSPTVRKKMSLKLKGKTPWNKDKKGVQVAWNKGKKFPQVAGDKNHNWKGGITKENHLIRTGLEIKLWREKVFERDEYTCQRCSAKSKKGKQVYLVAHHIKSFALRPNLRFDVENGLTLCKECHYKEHRGVNYNLQK